MNIYGADRFLNIKKFGTVVRHEDVVFYNSW